MSNYNTCILSKSIYGRKGAERVRVPFRFRAAPARGAPGPAHSFERTRGHTGTASDLPRTLLRPSVPTQKSPSSLPLYSVPLRAALLRAAPVCERPTCARPRCSRAPLCRPHCVRGQPIGRGVNWGEGDVTGVDGMRAGGRGLTVPFLCPPPPERKGQGTERPAHNEGEGGEGGE